MAEKFSAKHVFGVGALVNAVCALLTPVAASASYAWLIVIRIIMGIAGVSLLVMTMAQVLAYLA